MMIIIIIRIMTKQIFDNEGKDDKAIDEESVVGFLWKGFPGWNLLTLALDLYCEALHFGHPNNSNRKKTKRIKRKKKYQKASKGKICWPLRSIFIVLCFGRSSNMDSDSNQLRNRWIVNYNLLFVEKEPSFSSWNESNVRKTRIVSWSEEHTFCANLTRMLFSCKNQQRNIWMLNQHVVDDIDNIAYIADIVTYGHKIVYHWI